MDQKFQLAKVKTRGKSPFEVYNVVFDAKGLGASYAMNMHEATWEIVKHSMNEKKRRNYEVEENNCCVGKHIEP